MKKKGALTLLSVLVLVVFALLAIGSAEDEEPEAVEETPEEEPADEEEELEEAGETFAVGETVKMGDLSFTLNSARWDTGDEFMQPEPGEKWLVLDCTIENLGEDSSSLSSLLMFSLYDEEHYSRDLNIFADAKGSLDGELGPGRTMRGEIAFDVEEGQSKWEFIFEPNVFGFGQAIYEITENQVE